MARRRCSTATPSNNFLKRALTWNPNGALTGASNITIAGIYAYITTDSGKVVVVNINEPLKPRIVAELAGFNRPRAVAVQFRYAWVVDVEGLKLIDITLPETPRVVESAKLAINDAHGVYLARTYAYVAAGKEGLAIVDIERPEKPKLEQTFNADGKLNDAHDVKVGMTANSLFAYVADGKNGLRVVQLMSPEENQFVFGFSPRMTPKLVATFPLKGEALALSKGIDRDRAADESGQSTLSLQPARLAPVQPRRDATALPTRRQALHRNRRRAASPPQASRDGAGGQWEIVKLGFNLGTHYFEFVAVRRSRIGSLRRGSVDEKSRHSRD